MKYFLKFYDTFCIGNIIYYRYLVDSDGLLFLLVDNVKKYIQLNWRNTALEVLIKNVLIVHVSVY